MGSPGLLSSQVPGDPADDVYRKIRDLDRRITELGPSIAQSFATTVADLTAAQADITSQLVSINALIGNEVAPGAVFGQATGFGVTVGSLPNVFTGSITVPTGFTKAAISLTGRVFAYNDTTAIDYLYAKTYINGYCASGLPLLTAANGGSNINVSTYSVVLTGLTAGSTIPISVNAGTGFANWAVNVANTADISGSILWFR